MDHILEALRMEAGEKGVFLPLIRNTEILSEPETLHGFSMKNRKTAMIPACFDADENGAPSQETISRYRETAAKLGCAMLLTEPVAVSADARENVGQLMLTEATRSAFQALAAAVKEASEGVVLVMLLDHAGRNALEPVVMEQNPLLSKSAKTLADADVTPIAAACGQAAKLAEECGFDGIALNVCNRNLFADSLAAYHRDGVFGGDFDDRSRFVRDCYTAMKLTTSRAFLSIRLCVSDGLPQPYGFGMAFEDESANDLSESVLLLQILQMLFGVELVFCEVGVKGINWLAKEDAESPVVRESRLCTCIGMLDSAMQQNVKLCVPQTEEGFPFAHLAAGMIQGEFATFAGFRM